MADVARAAGVSVASVSNYLNHRPYMTEAMRARIAAAVADLGYQVDAAARNLRSGQTRLLKLSIPDLRQLYFAELAEDFLAQARAHGYGVIVESTSNNRDRELESVRSMGTRLADGLILSPQLMTHGDEPMLAGDWPLVVLGERLFDAPAPHVAIGNRAGAKAVVRHLLAAGCRRIAVVGGVRAALPARPAAVGLPGAPAGAPAELSSGVVRTRAFLDAMREAGAPVDARLIAEPEGWGSQDGRRAVRRLLDAGERFDAVFALNDLLAWGVLRGLRDRGLRVPEDVRVVGFDNLDESAAMSPSLTTVDPHRRQIARLAVESLLAQIEEGRRAPAGTIEVPASLVCRESSPAR
ncbi:LacI family DNA-binding transcriptional regulator [Bifidobacterium pullorum subsp. saeculare]|uniref:LacI family DNA-binding transcriptional regulator n=2 Tax=Bifidobacterium pullorum TaxID=78448 RepID=A0A939BA10_9BIFI|nr:LacI family DNA-binding transcriptional regulator [Bifidobacterium pullorum subsp. saeculare]